MLTRAEPNKEVECPNDANGSYHEVFPRNGGFSVNCDCAEGNGFTEVDRKTILRWMVHLPSFLTWLCREIKINGDMEEIQTGGAWFLGRAGKGKTARPYYFLRNDNMKEAISFANKVAEPNPIILWLGIPLHTGYPPQTLVPLLKVIETTKTHLKLNRKAILRSCGNKSALQGADIILDQDIGIRMDGKIAILLFDKQGDIFQQWKPIRPQALRMIRFVHDMRNKPQRAFKLEEFRERGFVSSKTTASSRIQEINDLCDQFEIKRIFHSFPEYKWGLNPELKI